MKLRIEHTTTFTYDFPISEAYAEMRLKPMDTGGQHCLSFALSTEPRGEVMRYTDRYGNDVRHFDGLQSHQQLRVSAVSEVITPEAFADDEWALSPLDDYDYQAPTNYAPFAEDILAFAAPHVVAHDLHATALALMQAVYQSLTYERGVTDVTTTADQALELKHGVCQDFAHLLLAACRSQGLAARYVSGYLYTPGNTISAASHAWVDVCLPGRGWLALDPTHNNPQTPYYVRVAVGRDYADVPPTRGVYKGSAKEALDVVVAVTAL
jgi:transglutaminase-like putative cysteine protease